ncbi:hypothetical protein BDZ89DRAFT_1147583 [Hymenopellis radicata]|nr:hypothetical protein BDZ89DRAFT_1147583 [Hymenopellis radicata]
MSDSNSDSDSPLSTGCLPTFYPDPGNENFNGAGKRKKLWVVMRGRQLGVYTSWATAEDKVKGYDDNFHESCYGWDEAVMKWQTACLADELGKHKHPRPQSQDSPPTPVTPLAPNVHSSRAPSPTKSKFKPARFASPNRSVPSDMPTHPSTPFKGTSSSARPSAPPSGSSSGPFASSSQHASSSKQKQPEQTTDGFPKYGRYAVHVQEKLSVDVFGNIDEADIALERALAEGFSAHLRVGSSTRDVL